MRSFRLSPFRRPIAALSEIEESPWTRNWDHLISVPLAVWRRAKKHRNIPEQVPAKDRIRQWNIVPGDRIRVRGDPEGTIREVFGINRYRNLVFYKARHEAPTTPDKQPVQPSVPYSKCQLYIGDREFLSPPNETEPRVIPVFASRLGCTAPRYAINLGRFDWERFAVQTVPRLGEGAEKIKIPIPWPTPSKPVIPPIGAYDTPAGIAKEITWRPSSMFYPPSNRSRAKLLQDAYLHSIRSPLGSLPVAEYDQETSPAIEYVIGDELSNPHSRTKKQRRSTDFIKARELSHKRFLQSELTVLDGRTQKEALAEAEWKWTELQRKEEQERRKRRWVLRGGARRLAKRRLRKERKERKEVERMKSLILVPAPNQILPGSTQPPSRA